MRVPIVICGFCAVMLVGSFLDAGSLVYNIKVRRSFRLGEEVRLTDVLGKEKDTLWLVSVVPELYARSRHIIDETTRTDVPEKRLAGGLLFNARYKMPKAWWLEATTGLEKEHVDSHGTFPLSTARGGFDDIVITGGHNMVPTEDTQVVLYGLGGIPMRRKVTPQEKYDTLVGTRFFSVGIGAEFSYSFLNSLQRSCAGIAQTRFVHFFNRHWYPILPCDAKIQPGNITDLLCTLQYREKRTVFETGYNASFFTNQAVLLTTGAIKSDTFVRNSAYVSVAHLFKKFSILDNPFVLGVGFYLARAKKFDAKIGSCWLNATIIF